ncbi:MAG: hypothetical protein JKY65_11885, partial [Planctomycetes bacterium]|nr:hypothetical protein [Planctomycetota bacterium]
ALASFRACAGPLRGHDQPMVRHLAQGSPPLPAFPREPIPTRLFSAHGQDFHTGTFLSAPVLDSSTEARLCLLTPATLELINHLFADAFPWSVRGRGYGLALPASAARGELQERVALLNTIELLPLQLRLGQGHMFDIIWGQKPESEDPPAEDPPAESLARYLAADLCRHPARVPTRVPAETAENLVYARLLAAFRPGKEPPSQSWTAGVLTEAAASYSAVGLAALEQFVEWGGQPPRGARRRDPYRT